MMSRSIGTKLAIAILGCFVATVVSDDDPENTLSATVLAQGLPKALSDFTATLIGSKVYIAGGCDDPNGNTFNSESRNFECGSLSNSLYAYDIETGTFDTSLAPLPEARYRHAAAGVNGKVWILGGRAIDDQIISTVVVYDPSTDVWNSFTGLEDQYLISDHGGFGYEGYAHFLGGYDQNYTALPQHFRIDTMTSNAAEDLLVVEDLAPLDVERGDIAAAATDTFAVVVGGFTHSNGFCEPHTHAERYNFANNEWVTIDELESARADKALVALGDRVYAMGGERQVANFCDLEVEPEPGERTIAINDVERYDADTDMWTTLNDLPLHRFRFAAVAYNESLYTFGGQLAFDNTCNCFRASDSIVVYRENDAEEGATSFAAKGAATSFAAAVLAAIASYVALF